MIFQNFRSFPVSKQGELEFEPGEEGQFVGESFSTKNVGTMQDISLFGRRTRRYFSVSFVDRVDRSAEVQDRYISVSIIQRPSRDWDIR